MRVSVKVLGLTTSEVHLDNGTVVFFSYQTPVAAVHNGIHYQTIRKYSATTSKHVTKWKPPTYRETQFVGEDFLSGLLAQVVMEEHTKDVIESLKVLRSALVPHVDKLPDLVMQKIQEALDLLSPREET